MRTWPESGIIWCEREQTACMCCSTTDGSCTKDRCNIHDPDYVRRQEKIEETRRRNDKNRAKLQSKDSDPPAPIRNDSNKAIRQIEALERRSKYCLTRGWTKRGLEYAEKAAALKRAVQ